MDGTFLPDQPNRMLCENRRLQIPVMIGNTDDEFANVFPAKTYEEFETMVRARLGDAADEFLAICGKGKLDEAAVMENATVNGSAFGARLFSMRAAEAGLPAYFYPSAPKCPAATTPARSTPPSFGLRLKRSPSAGVPSRASITTWPARCAITGRTSQNRRSERPRRRRHADACVASHHGRRFPRHYLPREGRDGPAALSPAIDFLYKTAADKLWRK